MTGPATPEEADAVLAALRSSTSPLAPIYAARLWAVPEGDERAAELDEIRAELAQALGGLVDAVDRALALGAALGDKLRSGLSGLN